MAGIAIRLLSLPVRSMSKRSSILPLYPGRAFPCLSLFRQPPGAVISGPTNGLVGETLSFDGGGSSDSDGQIMGYTWDFGDGSTGNGMSVPHSYSAAGSYQVTLTVVDDEGAVGGGSLAGRAIASSALAIECAQPETATALARALRTGVPAVFPRVRGKEVRINMTTILPGEEELLVEAVAAALPTIAR